MLFTKPSVLSTKAQPHVLPGTPYPVGPRAPVAPVAPAPPVSPLAPAGPGGPIGPAKYNVTMTAMLYSHNVTSATIILSQK